MQEKRNYLKIFIIITILIAGFIIILICVCRGILFIILFICGCYLLG